MWVDPMAVHLRAAVDRLLAEPVGSPRDSYGEGHVGEHAGLIHAAALGRAGAADDADLAEKRDAAVDHLIAWSGDHLDMAISRRSAVRGLLALADRLSPELRGRVCAALLTGTGMRTVREDAIQTRWTGNLPARMQRSRSHPYGVPGRNRTCDTRFRNGEAVADCGRLQASWPSSSASPPAVAALVSGGSSPNSSPKATDGDGVGKRAAGIRCSPSDRRTVGLPSTTRTRVVVASYAARAQPDPAGRPRGSTPPYVDQDGPVPDAAASARARGVRRKRIASTHPLLARVDRRRSCVARRGDVGTSAVLEVERPGGRPCRLEGARGGVRSGDLLRQ